MVGKPKPGLWTPPLPLSKGVLFSLAHDFGIIVPGAFMPVLDIVRDSSTSLLSLVARIARRTCFSVPSPGKVAICLPTEF